LKHHKRGALPIPFYGIEKSKLNNRKRDLCDELLQRDVMEQRNDENLDGVVDTLLSYDGDSKRSLHRLCLNGYKDSVYDKLKKRFFKR